MDIKDIQNLIKFVAKSGAQEVSNVLDGASAILSQKGGNGLLSVRSGYLSTLSSVKTPRSKMSSVSIIHSAGRHEWSKYRSRNKKENSTRNTKTKGKTSF